MTEGTWSPSVQPSEGAGKPTEPSTADGWGSEMLAP